MNQERGSGKPHNYAANRGNKLIPLSELSERAVLSERMLLVEAKNSVAENRDEKKWGLTPIFFYRTY